MPKIIETFDGSHTLYIPEIDEHYHSIHGAVQESSFIFIGNGLTFCTADPVFILEVGFGTGLNALLTAIKAKEGSRHIYYTSLEKYPLEKSLLDSLNYSRFGGKNGNAIFNKIHGAEWNKMVEISKNFSLMKIESDLTAVKPKGLYDLIYFDAFGPDKQPEMWTREIMESIASVTRKKGVFVTYSAKGEVKRNLKASGFEVSLLPGPPGKRQMIRAVKI